MKNVLATIAGFIAASIIVYIFETLIGHNLFPLPEDSEPMNMEWIKNNMDKIPIGSKVFVVIAHITGIISGMFVAGFISKNSMVPAYIVGGLMLAATFFNIIMLPKEIWFSLADGTLGLAAFFFGKSLAQRYVFA